MDIKPKIDLTKFTAQELQADAESMETVRRSWRRLPPIDGPTGGEFIAQHLNEFESRFMKLDNPYGTGNHHRISWRRQWDVDTVTMQATHKPTGFAMAFNPLSEGGYTAVIWSELPPFGPDGTLAMAQMFGLRELLKDGWEIFHTVMGKGEK